MNGVEMVALTQERNTGGREERVRHYFVHNDWNTIKEAYDLPREIW